MNSKKLPLISDPNSVESVMRRRLHKRCLREKKRRCNERVFLIANIYGNFAANKRFFSNFICNVSCQRMCNNASHVQKKIFGSIKKHFISYLINSVISMIIDRLYLSKECCSRSCFCSVIICSLSFKLNNVPNLLFQPIRKRFSVFDLILIEAYLTAYIYICYEKA